MDGKAPIQVAESPRNVQFTSHVRNNGARPTAVISSGLLHDQSVPALSTRQGSIKQVPIVKEKAFESKSSGQLHLIPSSIGLAHSGTISVTLLSTKNQSLTRNIGAQSQPQLPQIPTP